MKLARREFLKAGMAGVALMAGAGCDQISREARLSLGLKSSGARPFESPQSDVIDPICHILNRAAFGARPGDYGRIRALADTPEAAARAYLDQQLQPEGIDDEAAELAVRRFETLHVTAGELFEYQPTLLQNELMRAALARAVFSERQLFETMVRFWSDHFNIDPSKGDCKWLKAADDREVIRKHALGNFSDLLRASAVSPAMLWYLDGRVNRRSAPGEKPNENYARELLELHTLGVHGGYNQNDVMELARCLTGWTVRSTGEGPRFGLGMTEFNHALHDFGQKTVLGCQVPAATNGLTRQERIKVGRQELDSVLRIVTKHPSTAEHLSTKLCRHFIADEPPASTVRKVKVVFLESDGNIRKVLRAVFESEEFQQSAGCKFKRPFTFVASALRVTGARTDTGLPLLDFLKRMGHAPFNYPTPDGYPDIAGPWMGTLLWRWNFAVALAQNQIEGTQVDFETLCGNAGSEQNLMAHVLGRRPKPAELTAFENSGAGLALLLASPGFQRS